MANTPSAEKRIRRNARRADVNRARRSRIRTHVKKVEAAIAAGNAEEARVALRAAQPELMRGVSKGVVHKNTASRKISRLEKRIVALEAPAAS
jgi:small subunit ribosomal protein S20